MVDSGLHQLGDWPKCVERYTRKHFNGTESGTEWLKQDVENVVTSIDEMVGPWGLEPQTSTVSKRLYYARPTTSRPLGAI